MPSRADLQNATQQDLEDAKALMENSLGQRAFEQSKYGGEDTGRDQDHQDRMDKEQDFLDAINDELSKF